METLIKESKNEKVLKSKDILFQNINKIINERQIDMKLQKKLTEKFMEKRLDNSTVYALFRKDMMLEQIENDSIRLICLCEGLTEYLETNEFSISDYFTETEILNYKMYAPKEDEKVITTLHLENVTRINKYEYSVYMPLSYLSKLRKSGLPKYNGNVQRPLKVVVDSKGEVTQRINMDKDNLIDLTYRFEGKDKKGNPIRDESKDLVTTNIYFFSIWEEGKEPFFDWKGDDKAGSIGTLDITPIFDHEDTHYAPFIIADGFHRLTAGCNAYDKMEAEGKLLDKGFMVNIVLATIDRAKVFVADTFKRTDIESEQKEAITSTPLTDALDTLITKCSILKNNVSNTYEEYKALKTRSYKKVLIRALEKTDIDFTKVYKTDRRMTRIAKIINNIFEYYKENEIDENNLLYSGGMFAGYIAIANTMLEYEDKVNLDLISEICSVLINMAEKGSLEDYNLEGRTVKVKELYKMLEYTTMEVCDYVGKQA